VQGDYNYNYVSVGEPNAFRAYGCGLPAEAEVPDAEMAGIILFLERCVRAAEETGAEPVHAIVAVDSEACLVDIEIVVAEGVLRVAAAAASRLDPHPDLRIRFFATALERRHWAP